MGFMDGLFQNKSIKPKAKPDTIGRAVAGNSGGGFWSGLNRTEKWDLDRAMSRGYERVVWVFRCVHIIASQQAAVPIQIKDYSTVQGSIVDDKTFYRLLNKRANPFESASAFRYRLSSQLLLSPKGAFIELVRSRSGEVVEVYLLDPGTVTPVKDPTKWVAGYVVKRADGKTDRLDPENILWVRTTPDPIDPYKNVTPLAACGLAVETDYLARLFNKNFLLNDGRPGMLIGINGDMNSEDAAELKSMFSGGYAAAGQTRVIEADNIAVVDFSVRPRDAQWEDAAKDAKDTVLAAFGVPESVLGNAAGRCLRQDENVFLANGQIKRAKELVGQAFELLQPNDEGDGYRVVKAKADYAKNEKIYKIKTFSGRTLETNGEHPLYMAASKSKGPYSRDILPYGWTSMSNIKAHFDQNDSKSNKLFTEVAVLTNFEQIQDENGSSDVDKAWIEGKNRDSVPQYLFGANKAVQVSFLSGLYSEFGKLSQHTSFDIDLPTADYARKLQILLQRVGVTSSVGVYKFMHTLSISGKLNMLKFLAALRLEGKNAENAAKVWNRLKSDTSRGHNALRTDGLPVGMIWDRVLSVEEVGKDQTVALTVNGNHTYISLFWEHNTYSNADNEVEGFWKHTMKTHCDAIADALEPLTGNPDDNVYIEYDYSTIDVLQAAKRRRDDQVAQDFARGALTIDQYLTATGREPWNVPGTRVLYLNNMIIARNPEDAAAVAAYPQIGQQQQPQIGTGFNPFIPSFQNGADGVVGGATDNIQGELAANAPDTASQTVNQQAARTLRSADHNNRAITSTNPNQNVDIYHRINALTNKQWHPSVEVKAIDTVQDIHRDVRNSAQGFIEGSVKSWSGRQLNVVKERLTHAKVRKGTRHWEGGVAEKSLSPEYLVATKEWTDDILGTVDSYMIGLLTKTAQTQINQLQDSGIKAECTAETIKTIASDVALLVARSAGKQSDLVQNHIKTLDDDGRSISDIQDTLTDSSFDRANWSSAIAKKAATYAVEHLYNAIYTSVDQPVVKVWCTSNSEQFRSSHAAVHGQVKKINEPFIVGSSEMQYPTGIMGEESNDCSCWVRYEIES